MNSSTLGDDLDKDATDFFIADEETENLIGENLIGKEKGRVRQPLVTVDTCVDDTPEDELQLERAERKIWQNLLLLGATFLLIFTAYGCLQTLQVTNCVRGLGLASLTAMHLSILVSAVFLPNVLIRLLGVKWTIVVCMSCFVLYLVVNIHPQWFTLIPGSVFSGLASAPLWTAESTYIGANAYAFAEVTKETPDGVLGKFFGSFSAVYNFGGIFGNVVAATVYRASQAHTGGQSPLVAHQEGAPFTCGAGGCGGELTPENITSEYRCHPLTLSITVTLMASALILSVAAVLLVGFLVEKVPTQPVDEGKHASVLGASMATVHMWKDYRLWMLVPIIMSGGIRIGIFTVDFNQSYVSCGIGVQYIGYIAMANAIGLVVASFLTGILAERIGRVSQLVFGMTCDFAFVIVMLLWQPDDQKSVYFFIATFWGVIDALIYVHIRSFIGVLFPGKLPAAFSNFYLWTSVGAVTSFAMSLVLCVSTKLFILLPVQLVALALYVTMEYIHYKQKKRRMKNSGSIG